MADFAIEAHQLVKKFPARPGTGAGPLPGKSQRLCLPQSMVLIYRFNVARFLVYLVRMARESPQRFACYVHCLSLPVERRASMDLISSNRQTMCVAALARC